MELVFNEWFLEYMVPGHPSETVVSAILDSLEMKGDVLVVRRVCPFTKKLYSISKQYGPIPQNLMRRFHKLMRDPRRIRMIDEDEILPISPDLRAACPTEDIYLVETACLTESKTIITTDSRFIDRANGRGGIVLVDFVAFVGAYIP